MKNTFNFCVNLEDRKKQYLAFSKEHESLLNLHRYISKNIKNFTDMRNLNICDKNLYELRYKYINAFIHSPKKLTIEDMYSFTQSLINNLSLYENRNLAILLRLREQIVKTNIDYLNSWCPKYEELKSNKEHIPENYKNHMDNYQIIASFFDNKIITFSNKKFTITPFDQMLLNKLLEKQYIITMLKKLNHNIYLQTEENQYESIKSILESIKVDINNNQVKFKECFPYISQICNELTKGNFKSTYFNSKEYFPENLNAKKDIILNILKNELPSGFTRSNNGLISINSKQFDLEDIKNFNNALENKMLLDKMKLHESLSDIENY